MNALTRALTRSLALALALALALSLTPAHAADPIPFELPAFRQITDHLIEELDSATITPPLARSSPLECLGASVHAPWQNPFSKLAPPLAARHVRMTLAAAEATVEYRDAFLVEAPRTMTFDVVPLERARLELGYRLFSCNGQKGDVTLRVRVTDATGVWTQDVPLEFERPKRSAREAFREVVVDLPTAGGQPAQIELTFIPERKPARVSDASNDSSNPSENRSRRRSRRADKQSDGVLVALAEPVLTGIAPGPAVDADTNVLWIVIDSVRSDAMGPSRAFEPSATPEIDRRIFAQGTGFTQAYSMSNQTRTSTMAMIASLPPSIGGFHSNSWAFTGGRRETFYATDPPLITRVLMDAGFRVAHFGHNHFLWNSEIVGLDNGFPRVVDFRGIPSDATLASESAIRFFERRKDERWFLMLNYTAPHTPYKPPDAYAELAQDTDFRAAPGKTLPEIKRRPDKADRDGRADDEQEDENTKQPGLNRRVGFLPRNYLGELMWVDHNLEAVFAKLTELGLDERTLVIVTADHGEVMNPAHACSSPLLKLGCSFNHSVTVYDDELNVPLGMSLPGRIVAGRTITTPVSHADIPPTILDLLGLGSAPGQIGHSLREALAGAPTPERPIYADGRLASALRIGDWKLIIHAPQDDIRPGSRMVDGEVMKHEVFDLANDPLETNNLATRRKDMLDFLLADLKSVRLDLRTRFEQRQRSPDASFTPSVEAVERAPDSVAKNRLMVVTDASAHRLAGRVSTPSGTLRCPATPASDPNLTCTRIDDRTVDIGITAAANASFMLELVSTPWSAPLQFDLRLDDKPYAVDRLRLGPWGLCLLPVGGALDTTANLALAIASKAPIAQPHEAAVYFWRSEAESLGGSGPVVSQPLSPEDTVSDPNADQALGGEVKKILKDLGYTH